MTWLNYEAPRFPVEEPIKKVEQEISDLFEAQAEQIAGYSQKNQLCIVRGPWASGKSRFLIPRLAQKIVSKGNNVFTFDCQIGYSSEFFEELPIVKNGIAILDEAPGISLRKGEKEVKNVLESAHSRGWNIIAVFASHPQHPRQAALATTIWKNAENNLGGTIRKIILPEFRLPTRQIAEEFINSKIRAPFELNRETLEYVLNNIPYNLRILDLMSFDISLELPEFLRRLHDNIIYRVDSYINKKDADALREKFEQDYQRIVWKR